MTDPFLMLDELPPTNYGPGEFPGAPWHPHRGFDTVLYLKQGESSHEDSMGNKGTLRAGDCQWLTAASGIEHNEGTGHPGGVLHGFQMWVNLPAARKMDPPAYCDIRSESIPVETASWGAAKIIAGEVGQVRAPVQPIVPVQVIDYMVRPGASHSHTVPSEMTTCILHVYQGGGTFGVESISASFGQALVMGPGVEVPFTAGPRGLSFLLLAGKPLQEPVAWQGPFVMNTRAELRECFRDYREGRLARQRGTYRRV